MVCGEGCFSLFYGQLFPPSLFAYNGLSLPWLDTIRDFRGGGGCAESEEGRRGEGVHCELEPILRKLSGAQCKLGSCKGLDAKIEGFIYAT